MRIGHLRSSLLLLGLASRLGGAQQSVAVAAPGRAALVARLDSLSRDFIAEAPAAGVSVAVVRGDDTLLLAASGEADREHHRAATPATVYRIGSITKQFTAAAVLGLVEQGRMALTDPVTKYLPQYPRWSGVTIRELLNHTAGIPNYSQSLLLETRWGAAITPSQLAQLVAEDTLDFPPGSQFRYSNMGYVVLGLMLERVTGRPFAELMAERFFHPLGMQSAGACPSRGSDAAQATGYDIGGGKLVVAVDPSLMNHFSAGALCMSVPDFLRWQTALTSGRIVSPATYSRMSASDSAGGRMTGYGFALMPGARGNHGYVAHGGAVRGFEAQQLWFPRDSLRVVVFTNTSGSGADRLAMNLAGATLGFPLIRKPLLPPAVPLAAADRDRYVGTYDLIPANGGLFPLRITADDDGLVAQGEGPGQGAFALIHFGANTFGTALDPTLRLTFILDGERATRALLLQRGQVMDGPRRTPAAGTRQP